MRLSINISIPEAIGVSDYVEPSLFLPSLKSIDVTKFLIKSLNSDFLTASNRLLVLGVSI